jgi:hypothetical protein
MLDVGRALSVQPFENRSYDDSAISAWRIWARQDAA